MKNRVFSLRSAIVFSVLALLSEAWRGLLDAMFVMPTDFGDPAVMETFAIVYTLLFAIWAWTINAAAQGSRRGLWAAFIVNALVLLAVPVSWPFLYCPAECQAGAGIFNLANNLNLIFGLLAAITLGVQIFRPSRTTVVESR